MSRGLLKSTAIVSAMTSISRILGFIRDMIFAQSFGAGTDTDAFFVAFRIPNFLRRLFAEGAFALAFVPIFTEYKEKHSREEMQALVDRVTGTLGVILFIVTATGVIAAPVLIAIFAPGFIAQPDKYDLTVSMLRITFPYLLFISLTACASGILNSFGQFAVPALTPVLLNISLIGAALWLAPQFEHPVVALAWGVFIAGVLQLFFQLPYLKKLKLLPKPRWGWKHSGVQRILKLMLPTLFGSSVAQINLLFDTLLASFLTTGSVSWLYYSDRLVEFPLGVFGVALGTVVLPSLSKKHASAATEDFSRMLDWGIRWVLLIGLPSTISLSLLSGPLLTTLFQYGAFSINDVKMASQSLIAYSLGLTLFMLIKVLAPGFYARQDTSTPVRIGIIAMVANMILNVLLIFPLAHAGLALATSLSAAINAGLLLWVLGRQGIYRPQTGWLRFFLQVTGANLLLGVFLWYTTGSLESWQHSDALQRCIHLGGLIFGGLLIYCLGLFVSGIRIQQLKS